MKPTPRSAEEQHRLDTTLTELFEQRIVFNHTLGLQIESVRAGDVRCRFAMRHELVGEPTSARLHGGVISAVLDAMGGLAVMVGLGERHIDEPTAKILQRIARIGTIDLRIDFLRQGLGHHFVATAEPTRLGGRIGSTQMRLVNDEGVLIATGAAAYILS